MKALCQQPFGQTLPQNCLFCVGREFITWSPSSLDFSFASQQPSLKNHGPDEACRRPEPAEAGRILDLTDQTVLRMVGRSTAWFRAEELYGVDTRRARVVTLALETGLETGEPAAFSLL